MYLTMLIAGFVIACICPPIGWLIISVAAYPILVGILCGVAYLAMSAWMIYS